VKVTTSYFHKFLLMARNNKTVRHCKLECLEIAEGFTIFSSVSHSDLRSLQRTAMIF